MDRALTLDERRSLSLRRAAPWLAAALLVVAGYGALRWGLTPTVDRADLRTGTVDLGPVEATIQVTGTVVPVLETVVTSPTAARVVRVAHPAGDTVRAGETVVALDLAADEDALRRLGDQVAIKRNAGTQERLTLDARLIQLQNDLRARGLDLQQAEALLAQQEGLRARGLATEPDVRAARVAVEKARLDVERLGAETRNARALTAARLDVFPGQP